MMKAMVFGMNYRGIIIFLALFYQPKKNTSLSAYGGSDTNAIYRNINGQFTSRFSQAENWNKATAIPLALDGGLR